MSPQDIQDLFVTQPFAPFDIVASDGSRYQVKHPDGIDLTPSSVRLILPEAPSTTPGRDRNVVISLLHIIRLEQIFERESPE